MVAMFECKKCDYKSIQKSNQEIQKVSVHGGNKINVQTVTINISRKVI